MAEEPEKQEETAEKQRRFIISAEERHDILTNFVSDIMGGWRVLHVERLQADWREQIAKRFAIVSGAFPSTADERSEAELYLYNDIARLSILGCITGHTEGSVELMKEIRLMKERSEQTNKLAMKIVERLDRLEKRFDDYFGEDDESRR